MTSSTMERASRPAPQRPPGSMHWLLAKNGATGIEVLTFDRNGGKTLPVFSFAEEAQMFLRFGGVDEDWRARESLPGEIVSVLYGPCAGVEEVALDPLPEMVAERFVDLVSLSRESFVARIMDREKLPRAHGLRERSPQSGAYCLAVSG